MSGPTAKDLARATDPSQRTLAGMVRRMAVAATTKILWRLTGVRGLDGRALEDDVEVFSGIGIYARPGANGKPEAIVVNVGNAKLPVIVATRDEAACRAIRDALGEGRPAAGETLVFAGTGGAVVYLRSNGTVEIRTASGTAASLATKADIDALKSWASTHTHAGVLAGAAVSGAPAAPPPAAAGTTCLKGE